MPTMRAASTPSRKVTIKACSILGERPSDFENEFQFQLYKDSVPPLGPSTPGITRGCDLDHTRGLIPPELEPAQEALGRLELRKLLFFGAELGGVHATPRTAEPDRMPKVQHLVIDDVLHHVAGNRGVVKDAADDDGIVGGIVMPEQVPGAGLAPA